MAGKKFRHLTYNDRLKIEALLLEGVTVARIAAHIGVTGTTIYREIKRGRYTHLDGKSWKEEERYSPDIAEQKYREHLKEKGRDLKIGNDHEFVKFVEQKIGEEKYSPAAVLAIIARDGLQFETEIGLSTMYNYIRNGVFLNLCLEDLPYRTKKKKRKNKKVQKRAVKGTSIEKRPEEVGDRERFGDWEMDTVVGPQGGSSKSFLVLTERKTRVEIVEILKHHTAEEVVKAIDRIERKLGEKKFRIIFRSITVDNGTEFSDFEGIERSRRNKKPRTKVYYCHPYCSCERGSNENQNRFIRRFFPKGINFDNCTRAVIKEIEEWINNYPRKMFGWKSAKDMFDEELRRLAM